MICSSKNMIKRFSRAVLSWGGGGFSGSTEERLDPRTLKALLREISEGLGKEIRVTDERASKTGCQTVWVEGDRPYIVKLTLRGAAGLRLEENAKALATVGKATAADLPLSRMIPKVVLTGRLEGNFYSMETALPGKEGTSYLRSPRELEEVMSEGVRFLMGLQTLSRKDAILDLEIWNRHFRPMIEQVGGLAARHDLASAYDKLGRYLRERLLNQPVPLVFAHGNFWIGNLLFDPAEGLTGVIDWDSAEETGLPLVDLLYFLIRTESLMEKASLGEAVTKRIGSDLQPLLAHPLVEKYCRVFSISMEWLRPLFYYCWIQQIHIHVRYGTSALNNPAWLRKNLFNVLSQVNLSERLEQ